MCDARECKHITIGFLSGLLVGAGVALLTAPAAGNETRRKIRETVDETREKTGKYINEKKDAITSAIRSVRKEDAPATPED